MIVKKLVSLMMLVAFAGLTAGDVFAAPKKNTNKRETTKTSAKANAKTSKAAKAAPSKTEDIPAPVDEDQFVTDNLAQSGTGPLSYLFVPGLADEVEERLKATSNYETMPSHYRKLIDANKDKYFWSKPKGSDVKNDYFFMSEHFYLMGNHGRAIIKYDRLDSADMMAVFEPEKKIKERIVIPKTLIKKLSEKDQELVRKITEIVNENLSFILDVPFFVPDMNRLDRGDYCAKFIPEKHLVIGSGVYRAAYKWKWHRGYQHVGAIPVFAVRKEGFDEITWKEWDKNDSEFRKTLIPTDNIATNKVMQYYRWGCPVYDASKVETSDITDFSGCFSLSKYNDLDVVPELILLNLDLLMDVDKYRPGYLENMRKYQYECAIKSLDTLLAGADKEREVWKKNNTTSPEFEQVMSHIEKELKKIIPPAQKTLKDAIEQKKFIYVLSNPKLKPKPFDLKKTGIMDTEYTNGRVEKYQPKTRGE